MFRCCLFVLTIRLSLFFSFFPLSLSCLFLSFSPSLMLLHRDGLSHHQAAISQTWVYAVALSFYFSPRLPPSHPPPEHLLQLSCSLLLCLSPLNQGSRSILLSCPGKLLQMSRSRSSCLQRCYGGNNVILQVCLVVQTLLFQSQVPHLSIYPLLSYHRFVMRCCTSAVVEITKVFYGRVFAQLSCVSASQ